MNEIQKIMFGELRPWIEINNQSDDIYKPLTRNLKAVQATFNPHYELDFIRHFSNKTQYYKKLIDNDLILYCNKIFAETYDSSENVIAYKIDKSRKRLHSKTKEVAEIINNQSLSLSYITSQNVDFSVDRSFKEATYIMFYLLSSLIKCWMEIQHHFENSIVEDDLWEISDFYTQLLQVGTPHKTYIKEIQKIEIKVDSEEEEGIPVASPIYSFKYKNINQQPANISDLLDALKKNKCIAQDTSITNFKRVFSGVEVSDPIKWIGAKSDLSYLIKLLINKHHVLEYSDGIWKTVCVCFVDENGNYFKPINLKDQKKPKLSTEIIEKIALLMI